GWNRVQAVAAGKRCNTVRPQPKARRTRNSAVRRAPAETAKLRSPPGRPSTTSANCATLIFCRPQQLGDRSPNWNRSTVTTRAARTGRYAGPHNSAISRGRYGDATRYRNRPTQKGGTLHTRLPCRNKANQLLAIQARCYSDCGGRRAQPL